MTPRPIRLLPLLLLPLLCTHCGSTGPARNDAPPLRVLEQLLREQTELYPLMTEADLYKLIHQAVHGPSHYFFGKDSKIDIGLNAEIARLKANPAVTEPMVEMLDPDLNLARVNLRPFLLDGGKAYDLGRAVARTALEHRGDAQVFESSLAAAERMLKDLVVSFDEKDLRDHVRTMRNRGFPAGNHSRRYADTYEPAYRLVYLQHLTDKDYGGRHLQPQEIPE